jgi:bacterioferritin
LQRPGACRAAESVDRLSRRCAERRGADACAQLKNDCDLEVKAVAMYNEAIKVAEEAADNASRELFERLLKDEEGHVDFLEAQLHQIKELGYEHYLSHQIEGGEDK